VPKYFAEIIRSRYVKFGKLLWRSSRPPLILRERLCPSTPLSPTERDGVMVTFNYREGNNKMTVTEVVKQSIIDIEKSDPNTVK